MSPFCLCVAGTNYHSSTCGISITLIVIFIAFIDVKIIITNATADKTKSNHNYWYIQIHLSVENIGLLQLFSNSIYFVQSYSTNNNEKINCTSICHHFQPALKPLLNQAKI